MSEYGKLWERVSKLRTELKQLMPGVDTSNLELARQGRKDHVRRIDQAIATWEALERDMEKTE